MNKGKTNKHKSFISSYLLMLCNKDSIFVKDEDFLEKINNKYKVFDRRRNIFIFLLYFDKDVKTILKIENIKEEINNWLNLKKIKNYVILDQNLNIILLLNENKNTTLIKNVCDHIDKVLCENHVIGIGGEKKQLCDISSSLVEAYEAIRYYDKYTKIIDINDIYISKSFNILLTNKKKIFLELFKENRIDEIKENLMILSEEIRKQTICDVNSLYPTSIKRGLADIFIEIINFCSNIGVDVDKEIKIANPYQQIMEIEETPMIIKFIYDKICILGRKIYELESKKEKQLFEKSLNIIKENIDNKQLDLNFVCMKIGLSISYYSSLFNKNMNCSFRDYINKIRIDNAISMLKNTNLKISEIAEKCGFQSSSYFISIFKKYNIFSPNFYRKKVKN